MVTGDSIQERVHEALDAIQREQQVRVLYAVESGSRAWGFPSADSDYDVRFLYVHRRDFYLSTRDRRDVIEKPITDDLDVSGWDLRKALRLFRKGNPPLLEWLRSPVLYREAGATAERLRELLPEHYLRTSSLHHYLNMARREFRENLQGEFVVSKKYFYVLRPLLAMKWGEQHRTCPPTAFEEIMNGLSLDGALLEAIRKMVEAKRNERERQPGPRVPVVDAFLLEELARWEQAGNLPGEAKPASFDQLDEIFRDAIEAFEALSS